MNDSTEERIQHYSPGEVILREGDFGDTAYIIHQGTVEVSKKLLGQDQTLATLTKGDFFGEISLISDVPRTATIIAVDEVQLLELNWDTFQRRVTKHGFLAVRVIKSLVERLAASLNRKESVSQELEAANNQLAATSRERINFIKAVNNELQTPLSLILGPLEEELNSKPDAKNISVALKNTYRILRILNQARDLQLLSSGEKLVPISTINLTELLDACGEHFKQICLDRGAKFTRTFNGEPWEETAIEDIYVDADVNSLEKIIFNYLSNALKFGNIKSEIELGLMEWNGSVRLYVRDNGRGIPPEETATIFDRFSDQYINEQHLFEATGMGLALVKGLAHAMDGKVGVDSIISEGSTFYYDCQAAPVPEVEPNLVFEVNPWMLADILAEENELDEFDFDFDDESDGQYQGFRVLVVDPVDTMRTLIARTLERLGCTIYPARTGAEGLESAREIKPDLVITDWELEELNGPDLIRAIKSMPNLNHCRVIMLTTKTDEESRKVGVEIGVHAYLGKPFNDQEVTGAVKELLELRRGELEFEEVTQDYARNVLRRFLAPALVEEVITSGGKIDTVPKSISATILFSDIVGFTALTSKLRSVKMARILNEYLHCMNEVIFQHGGTVDKFIGDAIMVIFGAPVAMDPEIQAQKATECALRMQEAMLKLNESWAQDDIPDIQMRIGIHHGPVVVGHFGSEMRSDYTAIGPTVNLASRVESHCAPGEVYISGEVCDYLAENKTTEVGSFEFKGVSGERPLYKLLKD